jgi:hypothetical protein
MPPALVELRDGNPTVAEELSAIPPRLKVHDPAELAWNSSAITSIAFDDTEPE